MSHYDIYKLFELHMPSYAGEKVEIWFPNGRNSIRVRHWNREEFIFTFNNPKDWRFETIDSYINHFRKENKNVRKRS